MTTSTDSAESGRRARLLERLDALANHERRALAPLLHLLVHDLNGFLSTVAMEGFTIGHHARELQASAPQALTGCTADIAAAADNLEQAAQDAARYLGCLRRFVDELDEPASPR